METMQKSTITQRSAFTGGVAALLALILGVVLMGSVFAQETPATPTGEDATTATTDNDRYQDFLNRLAANLGGTDAAALDLAIRTTLKEEVDARLAAGEISANAAEALKEQIDTADSPLGHGLLIGSGFDVGRGGFGHGPGRGLHGGLRGPMGGGFVRGALGLDMGDLAGFIGIPVEELRSELRQGMSLAEIAVANGKSRDELRAFLVTEMQGNLDAIIDAGAGTDTDDSDSTPAVEATPTAIGGASL